MHVGTWPKGGRCRRRCAGRIAVDGNVLVTGRWRRKDGTEFRVEVMANRFTINLDG